MQIETGFAYEHDNSQGVRENVYVHPSTLVKYGLINGRLEVRFIVETNTIDRSRIDRSRQSANEKITGFNPMQFGFKVNILSEKGIIPKTSLIMHIAAPGLASAQFRTNYYAPNFRFTMQHSVTEKYSLAYNIGAEWDGNSTQPTGIYTLTIGHGLTEELGSYVELYGFLPAKGKPDHRFDAGLTYLVSPNIQLDASGGLGITECSPDMFVGVGLSLRIPN